MKHVQQIIIHYLFSLTKHSGKLIHTGKNLKKLHLSHRILLLNNKSSLPFQLIFNHLGCLFQKEHLSHLPRDGQIKWSLPLHWCEELSPVTASQAQEEPGWGCSHYSACLTHRVLAVISIMWGMGIWHIAKDATHQRVNDSAGSVPSETEAGRQA